MSIPTDQPNQPNPGNFVPPPPTGSGTNDERLWAMLAHLSTFLVFVTAFGQVVAPIVIYMVWKDKSKFVAFHALQSFFFQLAVLVLYVVTIILAIFTCGFGAILVVAVFPLSLIYPVVVGLGANRGEWTEYYLVGKMARDQVRP